MERTITSFSHSVAAALSGPFRVLLRFCNGIIINDVNTAAEIIEYNQRFNGRPPDANPERSDP